MAGKTERGAGRVFRSRNEAAQQLTKGCWEGTTELVEGLALESMHAFGFRPGRFGLLYALAEAKPPEEGPYMSAGQFSAWRAEARVLARHRGSEKPEAALGISMFQAREACEKGATKVLALGCAHFTLGLPQPVETGDFEVLESWFRPRFGGVERVAEFLQVTPAWLSERLRGFVVVKEQRLDRLPPGYLIRALDWLWVVGPVSPFGHKNTVPIFPGQDPEEVARWAP